MDLEVNMGLLDNIRELNSGSRFASARPMAPATPVNNSLVGLPFNNLQPPQAPQGMSANDKSALALGLASGFAGMSGNPNSASIMAGISDQQKALAARREKALLTQQASDQSNRTAQMLIDKGGEYAKIGQALLLRQIDGKQAIAEFTRLQSETPDKSFKMLTTAEVKQAKLDPTLMYQKDNLGRIYEIGGNGTNVSVALASPNAGQDSSNKKLYEGVGTGGSVTVNALAQGYEPARATLKQIDLLSQLGTVMDNGSAIPNALLNLLPEGSNKPLDAYRAVANGVAQGMYVPGSGTQTENDFRILLSRAGSAGMSADARILIQKGLRAATQRKMDLGAAAMAFQMNANDDSRKVYQAKVEEIQQRPLFSKEERDLLQAFGPKFDFSSLSKPHQDYAAQLSDKNAKEFLTMSPSLRQRLYEIYLQNKVN